MPYGYGGGIEYEKDKVSLLWKYSAVISLCFYVYYLCKYHYNVSIYLLDTPYHSGRITKDKKWDYADT